MVDHEEIAKFFEEILNTLMRTTPQHADIKKHVASIRASINNHKDRDKYARALAELNDTEIEEMVRFVERPGGRHHITEIRKLWDKYGAEQAGRLFLKHFYDHNKSHLIHGRKLKIIHR